MKTKLPAAIMSCALLTAVDPAFAQEWTLRLSGYLPDAAASSADGSKLVLTELLYGSIYTSTDSGATWKTNNLPANDWGSVASSADGMNLAAAPWEGWLYTSTNAGATWTANDLPSNSWTSVAMSADGSKLVALNQSGWVYTSTNSGASWTSNGIPVDTAQWFFVNSSADGTRLVVAGDLGPICFSTNSGLTWTLATNVPVAPWQAVAASADGTKLVLVGLTNLIFTSSDSGITWKSNGVVGVDYWSGVASSVDGSKLLALAQTGPPYLFNSATPIYSSTDSGETWTQIANPTTGMYRSIVSSADGAKLVLVGGGWYYGSIVTVGVGSVFTSYSIPSPRLSLTPSNANLLSSWLVPSTNFVLQQSLDLSSWTDVTNVPMLNLTNLQEEVALTPTNSSGFFRLISK